MGESHLIAAAQARGMWQRAAANRYVIQEDATRTPKFVQCPLTRIVSRSQADVCHSMGNSYYWCSSSWGFVDPRFNPDPKLDILWQGSPSRENRSDVGGLDDGLSTRFSQPAGLQSLAAESNSSMKTGLMGSAPCMTAVATELELEWQLIGTPQPRSGAKAPKSGHEIREEDKDFSFEEVGSRSTDHIEPEAIQELSACESKSAEIMTNSCKKGVASYGSRYGSGFDEEEVMAPKLGAIFQEISEHPYMSLASSMKSSLLWRRPADEPFAVLVEKKSAERPENCGLVPSTQANPISKASFVSFDFMPPVNKQGDTSRSCDKNLLASLLCEDEPTRLERCGSSSSPFPDADPTPAKRPQFRTVSRPLTIPSNEAPPSTRQGSHSLSSDSRNSNWIGGEAISSTTDRGSGLLGEALCHSQTRAREAEKKIQQVYEEKGRLVDLFFKEASLSLTYRQWVTSLQHENMWLRMSARKEPLAWLQYSIFNPYSTLEQFSKKRWEKFGRSCYRQHQTEHQLSATWHERDIVYLVDPNDIMMGCSLAFALGLSMAGAGLMLGWGMGWILLAY